MKLKKRYRVFLLEENFVGSDMLNPAYRGTSENESFASRSLAMASISKGTPYAEYVILETYEPYYA